MAFARTVLAKVSSYLQDKKSRILQLSGVTLEMRVCTHNYGRS